MLVRVDLNVPVENGVVTDATRIERMAPAITEIADKGAQGDPALAFRPPEGTATAKNSLKPVAAEVAHIIKRPVKFVDDCIGDAAERAVAAMKHGDILLPGEHPLPSGRGKERSGLRRRSSPSSATSSSTTPSRCRTARTPRPKAWRICCRPTPDARCRRSSKPSRKCSTSRRARSRPSSAAPRFPPSSICSAICCGRSTC